MVEWNGGWTTGVEYWTGLLERHAHKCTIWFIFHGYNLIFKLYKAGRSQRINDRASYLASHDVRMRLLSETHLLTCILDLYNWLS